MKFVTLTILALILTACDSSVSPNVTASQNAQNVNVASVPCTWATNPQRIVAPASAEPPTSWEESLNGSAQVAYNPNNATIPSDFETFTLNYTDDTSTVWVNYIVPGKVNETESCPDFIDDGSVRLTFNAVFNDNYVTVTGTFTDDQGTHQITW